MTQGRKVVLFAIDFQIVQQKIYTTPHTHTHASGGEENMENVNDW